MHKILAESREATDPVEKRFLHSMLESMRVDLDTAAAQLGGSDAGSDAADLGVQVAVRTATRSRVWRGLVCGSPIFF